MCPSDAKESSLSATLELDLPEEILVKYSLTRQAKDGVLHRRDGHAKPPSPFLREALIRSEDLKDQ